MKNRIKYKDWFRTLCLGLAATLGMTACTEDHFDIQGSGSETLGKSIMENIESSSKLTDFAKILKLVPVKRDDLDAKSTSTYAELLNSAQSFTVWAPLDGTYDAQSYIDELEYAKNDLRKSGDPDKLDEAVAIERKIETQFVRNHIARFNYESTMGSQQVRMLNSKVYDYDANAHDAKFNGVLLADAQDAVVASNGAMHLLNGSSDYFYNIYDRMEADADFSSVYDQISLLNKTEFSEYLSTPGAMNEKGEMVYADSVMTTDNALLNNSGADIKNEDSVYVAVIPTDAGYTDALSKLASYFRYGKKYYQTYNSETGSFNTTGDVFEFDNVTQYADSMTRNQLLTSMYISASTLPTVTDIRDSAMVIKAIKDADTLTSTNGVVYINKEGGENPLFAGEPLRASNGYIFKYDTYKNDPQYSFLTKTYFQANQNIVYISQDVTQRNNGQVFLETENRNPDVKGKVPNNSFVAFSVNGTGYVDYRLPAVYSGKYKISVTLLPTQILLENEGQNLNAALTASIMYDEDVVAVNTVSAEAVAADTVKDYVLWEDFEFTKCYVGLPSSAVKAFPRLRLNFRQITARNSIYIARITIEPARKD